MKAVILAAGKGTRMKELTNEVPKPMLCVRGKPILEHIIERLRAAGIREFFIVTGFRAEVIEEHFGDGSGFDAAVRYGRQVVQDGTGKAPELARDFVGESPFILTYGDILVAAETYSSVVNAFAPGVSCVVSVAPIKDPRNYGLFVFDAAWNLQKLIEKPDSTQLQRLIDEGAPGDGWFINAGIYAFSPELFSYTARLTKSPRGEYELTDALTMMLAEGRVIRGVAVKDSWADVRDPQVLAQLEQGGGA